MASKASEKPNQETSDETLREATLADQQTVLDLDHNVYHGLDYLRDHYHDVVKNPSIKSYVYEKRGTVVGFFSARLIDEGQTLFTASGRLGVDSRGGGMYGRFKKQVLEQWRESRDLRYVTMTVNNYNMATKSQRILKQYKQIMEKDITVIAVDLTQIRTVASTTQTNQQLQLLTYDDVKTMLSYQPSQLHHLFPENRILLQWCPLRIMEANTAEIFNGHQKILAELPKSTDMAKASEGNFPVTFMSAGGHYSCQQGRNYDVDMYGTGSEEDLCAHLEWHILRLAEVGTEETAIMRVYYDRRVEDILAKLQKTFSIRLSDIPFRKIHVLEMDFVK